MDKVCGLDVHKDSVFACILNEKGEKILEERYGTLTPDLDKLRDILVDNGVGRIAMESTSIYWMPVWRILAPDFHLTLVNPYLVKQLPGRKSDACTLRSEVLKMLTGLLNACRKRCFAAVMCLTRICSKCVNMLVGTVI